MIPTRFFQSAVTALAAVDALGLSACEKKEPTLGEKIENSVGDALNTRENEKLKDAAEDIEKDVKKTGEAIAETIQHAAESVEKEADKASE